MANVLAVDDSASMRQMVSFTLKGAGYDVTEAVDGQDALSKARSGKVDVVLTDVNMPNMDGIELIRQLRGLPQYKFTPMLLLTTESGADKKAEGKAGCGCTPAAPPVKARAPVAPAAPQACCG